MNDEIDDEIEDKPVRKTWWDRYGGWIILLVILVGGYLRIRYLPPLPERYEWTLGVVILVVLGVVAYFSFIKPRYPD